MSPRLLPLTLLLVLLAGPALAASRGPAVGDMAPALLGEMRDGKPVTLSDFRGKVVVLAFWTSGCGYCLQELPALERLQRELGDHALRIVAININDSSRDYGQMLRQMRGYALTLARDGSGRVASSYGVQEFPSLWLIDAGGTVAGHRAGYGEDALPDLLEEIGRAVAAHATAPQTAADRPPLPPSRP